MPNYDDVRQNYGFKNVNLGNAYSKPDKNLSNPYFNESDFEFFKNYTNEPDIMVTALHELIGHGSGKLLTKNNETGETNYPTDLINPLTGEPIKNPYGINETFTQRFKKLASTFEESRAEAVAFYFLFMNDTWPLFCKNNIIQLFYFRSRKTRRMERYAV